MSKVFTITKGLENMGALRTGGQGSVYKGRRMGPIISAVKLLPTPIHTEDDDDKNFRNFQNEVAKLEKVNEQPNPNVVKILSSGLTESGSFPYIEMEYIEGPDLEELLKSPHDPIFTIKEVLKLADHLANALAHCHMVGVKHGDIKSNNVKYNIHSGNYVQRRTSIRHAGAIEFMAPEQNTGEMYFPTDIYSYGIILYELLAGQVPFPLQDSGETSRNAVMIAHMESEVPDLMELRKRNLPTNWPKERKELEMRVPHWLLKIISTCLEKDPEKRYQSGMALQEGLFAGALSVEKAKAVSPPAEKLEPAPAKTPPARHVYPDDDRMRISKPLFFALMGLFALSVITCGYLLFDQAHASQTAKVIRDTIVKTVPDTANKPKQTIDWRKRRAEHDSEVNAAAQQSIKNIQEQEKVDSARAVPDTAGKQ
jgi:serine/threonine protein kinase